MRTTVNVESLRFGDVRTYLFTGLFILGNLLLPQIFHQISLGGPTWLPIYFFTLIGAYKYGWRVGMLTALASPILNFVLFGMPSAEMVPAIVLKSALLAAFAGYAAYRFRKVTLAILLSVIIAYQLLGTLGEWAISGSLHMAIQDFRIGVPGILLQLFGGWIIIRYLIKK